ncbi:FKBP-type peptidyl-prolyl cis-trans isomerase [Muribaculaceae bacterium Isolate-002 (NCI)]|nr:FKBP-type peptidyl-prolyl cis-trans isomerase [Muribaculaceae bacterium Isolate-002 (NCI)]
MKLNLLRRTALLTVAAAATTVAAAQTAPADSTSTAMATIVAGYLQPAFERQYPADDTARQMFVDGIAKAFAIEPVDEVYYQGLAQGLNIRDNLVQLRAEGYIIDNAAFLAALRAILDGGNSGMTVDDAKRYMDSVARRLSQQEQARQTDFLAAQAARKGVEKLPSGLLFEVITEGEGEHPTADDTVEVLYTGCLANGNVFDTTEENAVKFPVKGLIPGFSEGLMLMRPGGTYRLYIPAEIGYGQRGAGRDIPPGAALEFTVTLLDIVK